MSTDGLNMAQRHPSITHPGQSGAPEGMGTSPLDANFVKRFPKYFVGRSLVDVSQAMSPWKQIVFTEVWVVLLQVSSKRGVNLYLPSVSFAFGIETT